jgi:uridine kinase
MVEEANDPGAVLVDRIEILRRGTSGVVTVALDGRSGAGKSTLAAAAGERTGALVIDGDDFYRGGNPEYWDALDARQKMDQVIDWARQAALLKRLRTGKQATWWPYDWEADDGRFADGITAGPAQVVILDGAYSARPELSHLLTLRVLLDVPRGVRRERLLRREGERYRAEWEARWGEAEDLYFESVMPPDAFDLVLAGG